MAARKKAWQMCISCQGRPQLGVYCISIAILQFQKMKVKLSNHTHTGGPVQAKEAKSYHTLNESKNTFQLHLFPITSIISPTTSLASFSRLFSFLWLSGNSPYFFPARIVGQPLFLSNTTASQNLWPGLNPIKLTFLCLNYSNDVLVCLLPMQVFLHLIDTFIT